MREPKFMQPYYQEFIKQHGEENPNHEYISWINGKHREFKQLKGIPVNYPYSEEMRKEFGLWLSNSQEYRDFKCECIEWEDGLIDSSKCRVHGKAKGKKGL